MDFDTLLPIFFVIVWILSYVAKAKIDKRKKGSSKPDKPSGWAKAFQDLKREIQTAIEAADQKENRRTMPLPRTPEPVDTGASLSQADLALEFDIEPPMVRKSAAPPSPKPRSVPKPAATSEPEPSVPADFGLGSPQALRKAIVLSEILGPPISLRNPRHTQ